MITHRIKLVPDFTFEEWLVKHPEIDKNMLLRGSAYIDAIAVGVMGTRGFTTRRTGGKRTVALKKVMYTQNIQRQYLEDLTYTKMEVPLDLNNAADQAYLRVMEKRERNLAKNGK